MQIQAVYQPRGYKDLTHTRHPVPDLTQSILLPPRQDLTMTRIPHQNVVPITDLTQTRIPVKNFSNDMTFGRAPRASHEPNSYYTQNVSQQIPPNFYNKQQ
jgi:hypothetical protein